MKKEYHIGSPEDQVPEALKSAGTRNPFVVPEGYFETLPDRVLHLVDHEVNQEQTNPKVFRLRSTRWRAIAASIAFLLFAGFAYALITQVIIPAVREQGTKIPDGTSAVQKTGSPDDNGSNLLPDTNQNTGHSTLRQSGIAPQSSHTAIKPEQLHGGVTTQNGNQGKTARQQNPCYRPPVTTFNRPGSVENEPGKMPWPFQDTLVCKGTQLVYKSPFNPKEFTHQWMLDGRVTGDAAPGLLTISTISMQAGTHRLSLVVRDSDFGSIATVTNVAITIVEKPVIHGDRKVCSYDKAVLNAGPGNPGWLYQWSTGAHSPVISVTQSGKYWVRISVAGGECSVSDTFMVTVMPKPSLYLGADRTVCAGDKVTLSIKNPDQQYQIKWIPGNSTRNEFVFSQPTPGVYKIKAELTGCTTLSDELVIQVADCNLEIPNVFTPNGDGRNDLFVIKGLDAYPGSKLVVSDRNGASVYQSNDYLNNWDGGDLPNGTYYYLLYPGKTKETYRKGTVMILR